MTAPQKPWTFLVYTMATPDIARAQGSFVRPLNRFRGSADLSVSVYAAGPGRVQQWSDGTPQPPTPGGPGDVNTLDAFLGGQAKAHPAASYAVVLWGHASGWAPTVLDPRPEHLLPPGARTAALGAVPPGQSLDGAEIGATLAAFADSIDRSKIALVALGGCQLSTIEVAYELRDSAALIVASETDAPADAWHYEPVLSRLQADPAVPAAALAAVLTENYVAAVQQAHKHGVCCVIAPAGLAPLEQSLGTLGHALSAAGPDVRAAALAARVPALIPDSSDAVDIVQFAQCLLARGVPAAVSGPAVAVVTAASSPAVVLQRASQGAAVAGFGGLSVYLPEPAPAAYDKAYRDLSFGASGWRAFVEQWCGV